MVNHVDGNDVVKKNGMLYWQYQSTIMISPCIFAGKASAPDFITIIWGTLAPPYPDTAIKSKLESLNIDIQAIESKHDSFHIQKMIRAIKSSAKY